MEVPETVWPYWVEWVKGSTVALHTAELAETVPSVATCRQRVPEPPVPEMMRPVVLAVPVLETWKSVLVPNAAVVEPMAKSVVGTVWMPKALALMAKREKGDEVPTPTLPALVTMKLVEVPVPGMADPVDDPMTKEGPVMPLGLMETSPQGEVLPWPVKPVVVKVVVAVPPNSAKFAERTVEDAPPLKSMREVVAL